MVVSHGGTESQRMGLFDFILGLLEKNTRRKDWCE